MFGKAVKTSGSGTSLKKCVVSLEARSFIDLPHFLSFSVSWVWMQRDQPASWSWHLAFQAAYHVFQAHCKLYPSETLSPLSCFCQGSFIRALRRWLRQLSSSTGREPHAPTFDLHDSCVGRRSGFHVALVVELLMECLLILSTLMFTKEWVWGPWV